MNINCGRIKRQYPWPENCFRALMYCDPYNHDESVIGWQVCERGLDMAILSLDKEREQQAIVWYYRDGLTLDQLAERFGVKRERARQIKAKAERRLRHPSRMKMWRVPEGGDGDA